MLHFWLIDDIYHEDEYGSAILVQLDSACKFNLWMGASLRPYIGDRVLEIGAGIGNLSNQFIPRELYVVSDINPHYLRYLKSYAHGKPYLQVLHLDAANPADFEGLKGQFDTVVMVIVLEHVSDERVALKNVWSAPRPCGRAVILVPRGVWLYGSLDHVSGHRERYTTAKLKSDLENAGFHIGRMFDFNRFSRPGWWLNGRLFRKKTFSKLQLQILNTAVPLLRKLDRLWPWQGLSLIAIGTRNSE